MTPRKIFEIMIRETVYKKLASPNPITGAIWLSLQEVTRRVDPQEYSRSPYSKYVIAAHCVPALLFLEQKRLIVERHSNHAIHADMLRMILTQSKAEVDAYLDEELKDWHG